MNWYLAKLVFRIRTGKSSEQKPQFDEQLRLISAATESEALDKARTIGKEEEVEFADMNKQIVKWQFVDVSQLSEMKELRDGVEVSSRTEEVDEADGYLHTVKRLADSIVKRVSAQAILTN